jgi:site-specific DNA recombinase
MRSSLTSNDAWKACASHRERGLEREAVRNRLTELEACQAALRQQRERSESVPTILLHPNAADIYRSKVADLETSLNAPEIRAEASDALRALIERVVLTPDAGAPDKLRVELYGDLAEILQLGAVAGAQPRRRPGPHDERPPGTGVPRGQLSVVAGAGFEPAAFRL